MDLADKDCKICHGEGVIEDGKYAKSCLCVMKNEFLEYARPYDKAQFLRCLKVEGVKDKDLFIHGRKDNNDSIMKSLLFHMKYTCKKKCDFMIIDPEVARMAYLDCVRDSSDQKKLRSVGILIIELKFDVKNAYYGDTIVSLMVKRRSVNLSTWIVSFRELDDVYIKTRYSEDFVKFIKNSDDKIMKEIKADFIVKQNDELFGESSLNEINN